MAEWISWLSENKEWLFSGIGLLLLSWLFRRRGNGFSQSQSGTRNIQGGGDVTVNQNPDLIPEEDLPLVLQTVLEHLRGDARKLKVLISLRKTRIA